MRKGIVAVLAGLVLLGGIGVAVAQLGTRDDSFSQADEPTDTAPPTSTEPSTTTSSALETTSTTSPAGKTTTTGKQTTSTVTGVRTTQAVPQPSTVPMATFPQTASVPSYPLFPDEPAPLVPNPQSTIVTPHPGTVGAHKVPWQRAEITRASSVRIHWVSGVAPCNVLDHVQVEYRSDSIVVTLFEGSDPNAQNQACIMIAQYKAVDVALDQPIGERGFVDGAHS